MGLFTILKTPTMFGFQMEQLNLKHDLFRQNLIWIQLKVEHYNWKSTSVKMVATMLKARAVESQMRGFVISMSNPLTGTLGPISM